MKRLLSKTREVFSAARLYVKRDSKVRSVRQALSDHCIVLFGLGCISVGAFMALPVAGWIVLGVLALVFNERVGTNA
jgi:hypothetical protein